MGGHGGLNILPQKLWNVYRRDNREKVETDEELLRAAKQSQVQAQHSVDLQSKISSLKHPDSSTVRTYGEKSDQDLYKQAKRDKRRDEKQKEKEIQEMVKDPKMIGEDGHFNLFINEEFEMREKEKLNDKEGIEGKNVFLKRTSNLGELFDKEERPWYGSKNRQMSKYEEALENQDSKKTKEDREKKDVKIMLKIGKQRLIFLARMNTDKEFGKVVFLDEKEEIKEKEEKHKDKKERKEKKEKKHKSHKKSKKDKKDKKEMKKLLKEQKLREIEALIDYQNRKM